MEPGTRLRPMASAVIQVKVYGEMDVAGSKKSGRLRKADWNAAVFPNDGGWVSKPFRYQGTDSEGYLETAASGFSKIFSSVSSQFVVKDSMVYVAPEKPGTYRVEVSLGSIREKVEITVDAEAPEAATRAERVNFPAEAPSTDPYRKLVEHWAPHVAQESWFEWQSDALRRFDYDGDWDGSNNWDNLADGSSQAYVYYAVIESETHWFLIYNFFHVRDYSDNCIVGTCHENDNEGVIMTVRKGEGEFGRIEAMETLAHNNVYSYSNESWMKKGAHNIEGKIVLGDGSHPWVFLEAGGHGALGGGDKKSTFDAENGKWKEGTGITYIYRGQAARTRSGMDRNVSYELLPIYDHWWLKARDRAQSGKAFSSFYKYQPLGGRPGMKSAEVGGSFLGIKYGSDKAKPFWGWHDVATQRRRILATGQWGADPAYGVSKNLTFSADKPVSLTYVYNPYLDVGTPGPPATVAATVAVAGTPVPDASSPAGATPAAATATSGACELDLMVDGAAAIVFAAGGAKPAVETLAGSPVEAQRVDCPSAPADGVRYEVEKRQGRGTVRLASPGRVEVQDPSRGAGLYKIVVRWRP